MIQQERYNLATIMGDFIQGYFFNGKHALTLYKMLNLIKDAGYTHFSVYDRNWGIMPKFPKISSTPYVWKNEPIQQYLLENKE